MSRLEELIQELCPDGVEFKPIKEVYQRLKGTPIITVKMKEIEKADGEENADKVGNMRDYASINELLVLANLESYNAILINQGKSQKERMNCMRKLVVRQLQTLEAVIERHLPVLGKKQKR